MSLENRDENEAMRHVPPIDFIIDRIEESFGRQLETLAASVDAEPDSERKAEAVEAVSRACKWIVRAGECASHTRLAVQPGPTVTDTVREHLSAAVAALRKVDSATFRRRMPYHRFDRSEGEFVYTSFTVIPFYLRRAIEATRKFDPAIYERLFGYVTEREEFLVPIAQ